MEDDERLDHELRPRLVMIAVGFWMFEAPCTQALWEAVMGDNPSAFREGGTNRPVENVSWDDCQKFLGRLNGRCPGLSLSLPSEAQWEYACRAGTTGARYGEPLGEIAWYSENSERMTQAIGSKRPNAWGLHDMLGNVWEWCRDVLGEDDSRPVPRYARRVVRGGSWYSGAGYARAACRSAYEPSLRVEDLGFRCAEFREGVVSAERSEPGERGAGPRSGPEAATRRTKRRAGEGR